jgi:glycosyltransferase involved in cell wall biosynthesis
VPIKVLYVSEAPIYGGAERYLITLAEGIDRSLFDIEMAISDQAPPQLQQALKDLCIPTITLAPIQGKTDIQAIMRHMACFKARGPQIVHFNLSNPLHGQYAMLAARMAKVPSKIATLHLPPRSTTPTRRGRFFERQTICRLDKLIAVCNSSRTLCVKHFGIHNDHTDVVYNGIDTIAFDKDLSTLPPVTLKRENEILLGTVGRLSAQKGFDILLQAMPEVLAQHPHVRLAIAGEGPEESKLKAQCKSLGIENQVDFLGMRADIPALLKAFDLFVLPSRYESFPISILEVMAASKPIVSTQVDGIPESVLEGQTGLLVPPENTQALAKAIIFLLNDPALCAHLSTQARIRVESCFSLKHMVQNTQNIYHQLCP